MSDNDKNQKPPFCMRLSPQEWALLRKHAAGMHLSEYARRRIFGGSTPQRRTRGKAPVKDHAELGQLLGALGRSRMPNNLNQLAKAVNMGELMLSSEQTAALLEACADIREMRRSLMQALGQREP